LKRIRHETLRIIFHVLLRIVYSCFQGLSSVYVGDLEVLHYYILIIMKDVKIYFLFSSVISVFASWNLYDCEIFGLKFLLCNNVKIFFCWMQYLILFHTQSKIFEYIDITSLWDKNCVLLIILIALSHSVFVTIFTYEYFDSFDMYILYV